MKLIILRLGLVLAISGLVAFAAESLVVAPGSSNSYETVKAPVQKIYAAVEGKNRFVAYVVKWKDAEIVVSDPLAKSNFKVGDSISFLAQKITIENEGSSSIDVLVFTLGRASGR